jgi:hypothetical protein
MASEVFEYLLGCPQFVRSRENRALLWRHYDSGGFENALAEVQAAYVSDPAAHASQLKDFQDAVHGMFHAMNEGFKFTLNDIDPQKPWLNVGKLIYQFDEVFTLNQDLLVEMFFFDEARHFTNRWENLWLPGIERDSPPETGLKTWATGKWSPRPRDRSHTHPKLLPYYKLHGSSSWRTHDNAPLLIMGGRKAEALKLFPILTEYAKAFEEALKKPNTRLMVVGYGFRDEHINDTIIGAVESGLQFLVVDPHGGGLARAVNAVRGSSGAIVPKTKLEEAFERGLIGATRRSIRNVFAGDRIERQKLERFFSE